MVLAILLLACWGGWRVSTSCPCPGCSLPRRRWRWRGLPTCSACPGSAMRTENEIVSCYKDFGMQSFRSKVEAAYSGALGEMFLTGTCCTRCS